MQSISSFILKKLILGALPAVALAGPPAKVAPPPGLVKAGLAPMTVHDFDQREHGLVQNAKLSGDPLPYRTAMRRLEEVRLSEYPSNWSRGKKRKVFQDELRWVEAQRRQEAIEHGRRVQQALQGH